MRKNDLKSLWNDVHRNQYFNSENTDLIKSLMRKSHGRIVSKIMNGLKLNILTYSIALLSIISIIYYALIYLKLELSIYGIIPFVLGGMFLLFKLINEIIRFKIFNSQQDNLPIRISTKCLIKKLTRIKTIDFIIIIIIFYGSATFLIIGYIFNFGGLILFFQSTDMIVLFVFFIVSLLILPWLIKKSFYYYYEKLSSNLINTLNNLDEVS